MESLHILRQFIASILLPSHAKSGKSFLKRLSCHAESGTGRAGIIDRMSLLRGILRIDPKSDADTVLRTTGGILRSHLVPVSDILRKGIKNHMVAERDQFLHIAVLVRRSKHMVLTPHLLCAETRLVESARCGTADVLSDQRIERICGKRFLRQQDMASRILLQIMQYY